MKLRSPRINSRKLYLAVASLLLIPFMARESRISADVSKATVTTLSASAHNARLKYELEWYFGKPQRGWYLYVPLICHLIGVENDPDSDHFALALTRWQQSLGLPVTGILDRDTWAKMISVFQSRRAMRHKVPPSNELFQAPPTDFYHNPRPDILRFVERQAYEAYKRMLAAAAADPELQSAFRREGWLSPDGDFLKIISAFRSPAYQASLRKLNRRSGRAGLAVHSPHFTGRALDLYVGGEPVSTNDHNRAVQIKTAIYQWLVKNAERFGFYPYFYEPWHWEFRME
jgi:zinc D-Ala-D-Ala carboxypeptidase